MRTLLLSLVLIAAAAHAYEVKRDSTGAVTAWKAPLHFVIDASLDAQLTTPDATAAVKAALGTVQATVPFTLDGAAGASHGVGFDFAQPQLSTSDVLVPADWKFDENAVAVTVISVSRTTHEILEADIAFNAKHTAFGVVAPAANHDRYDVQNAMTHELGHALGLAHNPGRPESLMYPHSVPGEVSKRALAQDDLDGLEFLYGATPIASVAAPNAGCSATGSAPFALLAAGLLLMRRRAVLALAGVLGALLFVGPVFAEQASAPATEWRVTRVQTFAPGAGPAVLESELTVVRAGLARTVRMAGGRWGDVEQFVEGVAVPVEGDSVTLVDDTSTVGRLGH